jgi:hypothetical protein
MPFPHCRSPGAKPLEPFGKGSNALKAGTPDAGPDGSYRAIGTRPSVQPPAGVERKPGLYAAGLKRQADQERSRGPAGVWISSASRTARVPRLRASAWRSASRRCLLQPMPQERFEALLQKLLRNAGSPRAASSRR